MKIEAEVFAVSKCGEHRFSKFPADEITLIAGEGVEGDAHRGVTVKHRSRVKADPTQPNLRQVHLVHNELLIGLREQGFDVEAGTIGENILTEGIDLLGLPTDAVLKIGDEAVVRVTGLRNPCGQLDNYQDGLTAAVLDRDDEGNLIRKSGIMGVVVAGGVVKKGDEIVVELPDEPFRPLERV